MADNVLEAQPVLERFRLDGKTALVTGGGQGIGRAFAHALGEAGAAVAVVDINSETAETVADELSKKGIDALAVTADVTKQSEIDGMMKKILDKWGKLTIGVNNAGIGNWTDAEEIPRDLWSRIVELNLNAVFFCAQAEAKVMIKEGYGKIINTASMSAHIVNTPQHQVPYNTTKAGVLHMTRSLGAEWAMKGIKVNSISPGYTNTKLVADLVATPEGKKMKEAWIPMIPMQRMAEVTDLQGAVVYLASEASDYMTGQDMIIDGGFCDF